MSSPLPTKVGLILFPGFQLLDATGPLDALSLIARQHPLSLSIIAASLDPVPTQNSAMTERGSTFSTSIVPTHTFATAPKDLDMILLPGGMGARGPEGVENTKGVMEFVKTLDLSENGVRWILTVCTGSEILARTGMLDGRRATTNKTVFNEVCSLPPFPLAHSLLTARIGQSRIPHRYLDRQSALGRGRQYLDQQRYFSRHRFNLCVD
jgi:putative intracellular protease/amidase